MNDLALTPAASAAAATEVIKAEVRTLTVTGPDVQALLDAVAVDLEIVPQMDIDSAEMEGELTQALGRLSTVSAAIDDERKERGRPLREALDWLMQGYSPAKQRVDEIIATGKSKLSAWLRSERERVARERAEAEERARKAAAEAAAAEAAALAAANAAAAQAQALRDAGSEQVAQAMETQAMVAVDAARQSAAQAAAAAYARPVVIGPGPRKASVVWKGECSDKAKLLVHIGQRIAAGDTSLMNLVVPDEKAINALAKLQEQRLDANVPGLHAYSEERSARITKVAVSA